jgi:putative PIN family toxin of toxin-antitoxin system
MSLPRSAVFDCNVFLQAMLSSNGASHACWRKVVAGDVTLFVTPYMLAEIRELPDHPKLKRFSGFTRERVERFIEELLDIAEFIADPPATFRYSRDPDDAHYVDVALATHSMLVVSNDKDLLDLMNDSNQDGRQLREQHPDFAVLTPPQFLVWVGPRTSK